MTLYTRDIKEVQAKARSERYSPYFYALDFDVRPPSVALLPTTMTINGISCTPDFRYTAKQASTSGWPAWGYGPDLIYTNGSGTVPTFDTGSPLLGDFDGSVTANGTGAAGDNVANFQSASSTVCNIGTKDVVFEVVLRWPATTPAAALYAIKKDSTGATGWDARVVNRLEFYLSYSASHLCVYTTAMSSWPGVWCHAICFVDRSGSAIWYVNGSTWGSAVDVSSGVSWDLSPSDKPFCLLSPWNGTYAFNSALAYCAMWSYQGWLNTHLQPTIAFDRFSQMQGLEAIVCPRGSSIPTTKSRDSIAYLDKYESDGTRRLWQVAGSWLRGCERKDTGGVKRRGYLSEITSENLVDTSQDWSGAAWDKWYSSIPTTSVTGPDGVSRTVLMLKEDSSNDNHMMSMHTAMTCTGSVRYVCSVWAKAYARNWCCLRMLNAAWTADYWCFFNLSTGEVGTTGGTIPPDVTGIELWGNDWYRIWVSRTHNTDTAWHLWLYAAYADNDNDYQGLSQDSMAFYGAQVELGRQPTSYYPTSGAKATRYADSLIYRADVMPPDGGAILCVSEMRPDQDYSAASVLLCCDDGSASNIAVIQHAANAPRFDIRSGGGGWDSVVASTDTMDGDEHVVTGLYKTNLAQLYVDGVKEGTDDTSVTLPVGVANVRVGAYTGATAQTNALLSKVRID